MHLRLGHHADHGHRCHGMEHGRLRGCNRGSLFCEVGCGGLERGHLHSSQSHYGRDGERFGWGREGRVRFDDSPIHHRRRGSIGGMMGGLRGLNLGGDRLGDGGGLLGGGAALGGLGGRGPIRRGPLDGLGSRGSPFLGRGLDAAFLDPRESPYLSRELGLGRLNALGGLGSRDRLEGGRPFSPGGMGLGFDLEGRSRSPSLRGSNYSLDHLDRCPRPYHYQPPYVEDWESVLEDELLRPELVELLDQRDGIIQGAGLYGLPAGYDIEDLMGGRGGLGGRRGRL